jgi:hypothetical protein
MFGEFVAAADWVAITLATKASSRISRRRGLFTPLGC